MTTARIAVRLRRLRCGNFGDAQSVDGVSEFRLHDGPGYRVDVAQHDARVIVLLCGGDTTTQAARKRKAA